MKYNFYLDICSGVVDISSVLSPDKRCAYIKDRFKFVGAYKKFTKRYSTFFEHTVIVHMGRSKRLKFKLTDTQIKMRKDYNVTTKELELIEKGKTVKFFSMVYLDSFTGKIGNKHTLGIKRRKEYHTRYLPIKYSRRWNHWGIQYEDCIWKVIACDNGRCSPICNRCLIKHELTFNQIIQKAAYENG